MTNSNPTASSNFLVSAPTSFHASVMKVALQINEDTFYPLPTEEEVGFKIEKEVYNLLLLLDVEEVFLAPSEVKDGKVYPSYADTKLKADVFVKVGRFYLGWQIKSSLGGVKAHQKHEKVTFQGKSYPTPGVIMINHKQQGSKYWKVKLLNQVASVAGVPVKESVAIAIEKWKKVKVLKEIPPRFLHADEIQFLHVLGLVRVHREQIIPI